MKEPKWHSDRRLVENLPLRYRAYAAYSRAFASAGSRRVPGGSALLRLLRRTGGESVVKIRANDDDTLLADFSDDRILEVLHEIRRENPEFAVLSALLNEGSTFIDVGANYGTFSVIASRLAGASGRVIAIEPQPRLAGFIAESARESGIDNIEVIEAAAGAAHGRATLLVPAGDTGRAGLMARFSGRGRHDAVDVKVIPLDDLEPKVTPLSRVVMKIDVEGSEMNVLEGGRKLIASTQPTLIIELNPWSADASGNTVDDLLVALEDLGYSWFSLARDFPRSLRHREIPRSTQENLVAAFEKPS